ncbi:uncharacterized protein TRIADDRAFT_58243 [Trichoplax adhaerens]|uniref:Uncharacterized protein n=1 Tax=Trichoplax adhaerens TaxID=10228 RepID=B3S193_TRIAD|nr:hypothetical protein TRIADDRAFT_58243 [Trichoplax adhaerens]EDV23201.1 hypothetical protein TRIADDRAFT_58243 [Trichoplax adhaerens]|eukprot:XP_002114111.1 hypothetical protein TRIADDRAFT_58243 [Trichoplax adhaerens]
MASHYLYLSSNPIRFTPVNQHTNVFFDEANGEVFTLDRKGGEEDDSALVVVKSLHGKNEVQFRLEHGSQIKSIKFSPNRNILSVLRSSKMVTFINCRNFNFEDIEYRQTCKSQRAEITSFHWTSNTEVVFITNQSVEYYQVNPDRNVVKLLKLYSINVNWAIFQPRFSTLVVSSSASSTLLQPYMFQNGQVNKLPKFEVAKSLTSEVLQERDVVVTVIYGQLYILVLRSVPRSQNVTLSAPSLGSVAGDIVMYALYKDSPARVAAILSVNIPGSFATHIVDNLILVHHLNAKVSLLFDIFHSINDPEQIPTIFPILAPLPIETTRITFLDAPSWVTFQPNIVIDAKLGCIWQMYVKLNVLETMITDKNQLLDILLLRKKGKEPIIDLCKQALTPGEQNTLQQNPLRGIFDKSSQRRVKIDQSELYSKVLTSFLDNKKANRKFLISVLIDYIRSLNFCRLSVQYCICELLINLIVENKSFYQLHQLLQYRILTDSKPLACLVLSLEKAYPPAFQLAMDMLKRIPSCNEDVVETLLSKKHILAALQYTESIGRGDSVSARKYLELAQNSGDKKLLFTG